MMCLISFFYGYCIKKVAFSRPSFYVESSIQPVIFAGRLWWLSSECTWISTYAVKVYNGCFGLIF